MTQMFCCFGQLRPDVGDPSCLQGLEGNGPRGCMNSEVGTVTSRLKTRGGRVVVVVCSDEHDGDLGGSHYFYME